MNNYTTKKHLLSLPEEESKQFQSQYPRLMTVFLRRCIIKANSDRKFFEDIFFGVSDKYSNLGMFRPEYVVDDL